MRRDHERIDILVNNAGTIARVPAAEHPDELWDRVLEVNLTAQFILARELGREMLARGSGKIVFVASLLSFQGGITVPGYTASKSGVAGLTKALANEWAAHGVNVNAVAPGYVRTDNTQALRDDPVRFEQILAPHPGRPLGRARGHRGSRGLPLLAGGRLRGRRRPARRRRLARPVSAAPGLSEETVLATLARARVLPVVALDDASVVPDLCAALLAGGISTIEITFRTAAAAAALERASEVEGMVVGAGTVLTVEQARAAAEAGAAFAVAPGNRRRDRRRLRRARAAVLPRHRHAVRARARAPARMRRRSRYSRRRRWAAPRSSALSRRRFPRRGSCRPAASTPGSLASYLAVPAVVACGGSWICDARSIRERRLRRDRAPRACRDGGDPDDLAARRSGRARSAGTTWSRSAR